jgi:hypothetical protein
MQSASTNRFPVTDHKNGDSLPSVLTSLLSGEYATNELNHNLDSLITSWHGPRRKHYLQHFLSCCAWTVRVPKWSLPSQSISVLVAAQQLLLSRCLFRGLCLAMGLWATIWCWATFAFIKAADLLGMNSYKFWTVSSGILYQSSWRTLSSCFRVVGGENLFLTLVSKSDQSGSMVFKSGDFAGQGRCSNSCSSNYAVWIGTLSCGNLHRSLEITSGSWDSPDYPTCPRTPLQYFGHEGY